MKYMLLMYANETETPQYTGEEYQASAREWYALMEETKAAGVYVANNGLSSVNDATTVRIREGKEMTIDGPFAETHEQLGGYIVVDCKDLDEAIRWAKKIPTARYGSIEVRPLNVWSQNSNDDSGSAN